MNRERNRRQEVGSEVGTDKRNKKGKKEYMNVGRYA